MKFKVFLGFIILFATYHISEIVGNNPIFILSIFCLFFVVAQIVAKFLGENGISVFGLKRNKFASNNLFIGYLIGILFYSGSFIVSVLTGKIYFDGTFLIQQMFLPMLGIILLTFLSSASEDILTRGYVFKYFPKNLSLEVMVCISSVIYVFNHIWRIDDGFTQWLMLFLMGLTYAIPFATTGSLWFTIGCHWGWNTVSLFKSQIGNMSDLKIIDHTTDWTYIYTMIFFLVFVTLYSKFILKKQTKDEGRLIFNKDLNQ